MNANQDQEYQEINENQIEENHPIINVQTSPSIQTAAQSHISLINVLPHDKIPGGFMNMIGFSYILTGLNLILFGLFLFLKIDDDLDWAYSLTIIPFYLLLASIGVCFNGIISHPSQNYQDLGKHMTLCTLLSNLLFIGLFVFLMMLKFDHLIKWDFTILFIPLYVALAITLFYICFIFPGLVDKDMKLYNEAFLILLYFFGVLVWIVTLHLKLDRLINWYNYKVFLVIFIVLGTHILLTIKNLFETENFMRSFQNFIFILLLTLSLVIIVMKLDGIIDKSWSTSCLPIFSLVLLIYGIEFKTIFEKYRSQI